MRRVSGAWNVAVGRKEQASTESGAQTQLMQGTAHRKTWYWFSRLVGKIISGRGNFETFQPAQLILRDQEYAVLPVS